MRADKLAYLICIITLACLNTACSKNDTYVKSEGMIWNTIYHITYKGSPQLQDSILPVLNEVSASLSVFDKNSLVSRLNDSQKVEADQHLKLIYETSRKIHSLSKGVFDPTVSPLVDAWGFGRGHNPTKDTLAIDSLLEFVGFDKTRLEGGNIIKEDIRIQFNFSAIAKGYGCDAVGEMFRRNGVTDYMVEIGGELALSGKSPSGNLWNIAIDAPVENLQPGEQEVLVLELTDCGIATSGNYRNYREVGGQKYVHTISPTTGRPIINRILSATVIAPTCMEADAIATACMALDDEGARELLWDTATEGLFIYNDSVWMSPGFSDFITP